MRIYPGILGLSFLVIPLLLTAGCATMESDAQRDTRAYFDRGEVYSAKGQYDQAIAEFTKAAEISPRLPEIYNNRGLTYQAKGQYDQALSDFNKALGACPTLPKMTDLGGQITVAESRSLILGQMHAPKFSSFLMSDRLLELNQKFALSCVNRGNLYYQKAQYDPAIADFSKALEINPKWAEVYENRGVAYYYKGQYDQALSDYNKALEISPKFAPSYSNRGRLYFLKKEYDKAWEDVHEAQGLGYKLEPKFLNDLREASGRGK